MHIGTTSYSTCATSRANIDFCCKSPDNEVPFVFSQNFSVEHSFFLSACQFQETKFSFRTCKVEVVSGNRIAQRRRRGAARRRHRRTISDRRLRRRRHRGVRSRYGARRRHSDGAVIEREKDSGSTRRVRSRCGTYEKKKI